MLRPLPLAYFSLARHSFTLASSLPQPSRRLSALNRFFSQSTRKPSTSTESPTAIKSKANEQEVSQPQPSAGSEASAPAAASAAARFTPDFPFPDSPTNPYTSNKDIFNHFLSCLDSRRPFYEDLTRLRSSAALDRTGMIFCNNECSLPHIQAIGFDYDHTLCRYTNAVDDLIYELSKRHLMDRYAYPKIIEKLKYDPLFPIRGLMWDTRTGFLLKLDQFLRIQTSCVVRGRHRISIETILQHYGGISVSQDYLKANLHLMSDLFSSSEICLLADISQIFIDQSIEFSPEMLYFDLRNTLEYIHTSGLLHQAIMEEPERYLEKSPELGQFLSKLRVEKKKTFLITNSGFPFVDRGMRYMLGDYMKQNGENGKEGQNWLDFFDVAIFSARKPSFWTSSSRFREIDIKTGQLALRPANEFRRGHAYSAGGLKEFTRLMKVAGSACLYLGDHVSADLVLPAESALWKTGAVVKEIAYETEVMAGPEFRSSLRQLLEIESLIDYGQRLEDEESKHEIERLKTRRSVLRRKLLRMFNANFGSVFRTSSPHRTLYFAQLCRVADIYMSSIGNFLHYPLNYCWYPSRSYLPHEATEQLIFAEAEEAERERERELIQAAENKAANENSPPTPQAQ